MVLGIDYRCEDRKKVGELRGNIGAPSFRKPRSSPTKNELFGKEMHSKIQLSSFKPGFEIVKF
jgi:hypothetical protein